MLKALPLATIALCVPLLCGCRGEVLIPTPTETEVIPTTAPTATSTRLPPTATSTAQPTFTPTVTPFGGGSGRIAFCSTRGGGWQDIYLMDLDGSNLVQLTTDPCSDLNPSWSPDGQEIAFVSCADGDYDIHLMDADGSNQRNLTSSSTEEWNLDWSPDGQRILFDSNRDGNREIYAIGVNDGILTRLTRSPGDDGYARWSPDGERIAFVHEGRVFLMNADGTNPVQLSDRDPWHYYLAWSPDGRYIISSASQGGRVEIYRMDADGSNVIPLTHNDVTEGALDWSPDGSMIVFTCSGHNLDICMMRSDGTQPYVRLLTGPSVEDGAVWAP